MISGPLTTNSVFGHYAVAPLRNYNSRRRYLVITILRYNEKLSARIYSKFWENPYGNSAATIFCRQIAAFFWSKNFKLQFSYDPDCPPDTFYRTVHNDVVVFLRRLVVGELPELSVDKALEHGF